MGNIIKFHGMDIGQGAPKFQRSILIATAALFSTVRDYI